eukprot:gi/632982123/ref/XP_007907965.1/ PREDICTED: uncharacterized protein LOC103189397 [Callorhinchus milii]
MRYTVLLLPLYASRQFCSPTRKPLVHSNLLQQLSDLLSRQTHSIHIGKVAGHQKQGPHTSGNQLADHIAKAAAMDDEAWSPPPLPTASVMSISTSPSLTDMINLQNSYPPYQQAIQWHVEQLAGGHFSPSKTITKIRNSVWWPGLSDDVLIRCKKPLLTASGGYKYCLVIIDKFTKWMEAFPTKNNTALTAVRILLCEVICRSAHTMVEGTAIVFDGNSLNPTCYYGHLTIPGYDETTRLHCGNDERGTGTGTVEEAWLKDMLKVIQGTNSFVAINMGKSKQGMKRHYDSLVNYEEYEVGDEVMTRIYRKKQSAFAPKWKGPYEIMEKASPAMYLVYMPLSAKPMK